MTENNLNEISVSEQQIKNALESLKVGKSPGPDGVHPRVLKELAVQLAQPLKLLFDKTMLDGKLPSKWKEAEVSPIFKKGDKHLPGNYRPVSLTSVICKVFEGFVRNSLFNHLVENDLLSDSQFGFCKGRSCVTQLLVTLNEWLDCIDRKIPVDAAYLDFRKAFDSVPHERLLTKLKGYGITDKVYNWIRDFLSNRTQYVKINGKTSQSINVSSGVPQGSVLGPTLFIYFINDLPLVANGCPIKIFADDTKAYIPISSYEDKLILQGCIDALVEWSNTWLLKFNSDKCKLLHLGKNNPNLTYSINEGGDTVTLAETNSEKDLGVIIDPLLNFDEHISCSLKKCRSLSAMVIREISCKDSTIMVPLFKSIIRPIIEYANVAWCPNKRKHIDRIEKLQRHFTKRISGMRKLSYYERLQKLKLPSLEFRRVRGDLIEVYKMTHNYYDTKSIKSLLTLTSTDSPTRTNGFKLFKPRVNTYIHFFTNRIINKWNGLPSDLVNADGLNAFKNKVDTLLKDYKYCTNINIK